VFSHRENKICDRKGVTGGEALCTLTAKGGACLGAETTHSYKKPGFRLKKRPNCEAVGCKTLLGGSKSKETKKGTSTETNHGWGLLGEGKGGATRLT